VITNANPLIAVIADVDPFSAVITNTNPFIAVIADPHDGILPMVANTNPAYLAVVTDTNPFTPVIADPHDSIPAMVANTDPAHLAVVTDAYHALDAVIPHTNPAMIANAGTNTPPMIPDGHFLAALNFHQLNGPGCIWCFQLADAHWCCLARSGCACNRRHADTDARQNDLN